MPLSATIETFAREVASGLNNHPKYLPTRYIYDDAGSKLFEQIMDLPEYYPAQCEKATLQQHAGNLSQYLSEKHWNIVELGAGNGIKTGILLQHFLRENRSFTYIPVDISALALKNLSAQLYKELPNLAIEPFHGEYFEGLRSLSTDQPNLILFLGGNIGNFAPAARNKFLRSLRHHLKSGDIIYIGFDLKKDPDTMVRAYNDSQGITRAFNLNLLHRINRELGGDFDVDAFSFYPIYNPASSAIESYLLSRKPQTITIDALEQSWRFEYLESIHTESSYKFNPSSISDMAEQCGFREVEQFFDEKQWFTDVLWTV